MEEKYLVVEVHKGLYVERFNKFERLSFFDEGVENYEFTFTTDIKKARKFDSDSNTIVGSDASVLRRLLKGNYIVYTIKHEIVEG